VTTALDVRPILIPSCLGGVPNLAARRARKLEMEKRREGRGGDSAGNTEHSMDI